MNLSTSSMCIDVLHRHNCVDFLINNSASKDSDYQRNPDLLILETVHVESFQSGELRIDGYEIWPLDPQCPQLIYEYHAILKIFKKEKRKKKRICMFFKHK